MAKEIKKMKPIWYFVGLILLIMGAVILLAGIYGLFFETKEITFLAKVHPNIWWGGFMVIIGLVFLVANKNAFVD
jgi:hypothetical protein